MRRVRPQWIPWLFSLAFLAPGLPADSELSPRVGTHWAEPSEFAQLESIGYSFAVITVDAEDPSRWRDALDAAEAHHIQVIIGPWPPPWHLQADGSWHFEPSGVEFLRYLASRPKQVLAVFGLNEPYWTGSGLGTYPCGYYSAEDLRRLRSAMRAIWPQAKVYHDLGEPSSWAPGGTWWNEKRKCIGDKYRDQTGMVDYAGIWAYPFDTRPRDSVRRSLDVLAREIQYVRESMQPAVPVLLAQAFASREEGLYFPSPRQISDWNCALRGLGAEFISWYAWRQEIYEDMLCRHPEDWPATARNCRSTPSRRLGCSHDSAEAVSMQPLECDSTPAAPSPRETGVTASER